MLFILVMDKSSILGTGRVIRGKRDSFHPGLKHALMSLVTPIYVITPLEVVSGLLVPLQTSGKAKDMLCSQQKWLFFFLAECTQYQLGLREIAM